MLEMDAAKKSHLVTEVRISGVKDLVGKEGEDGSKKLFSGLAWIIKNSQGLSNNTVVTVVQFNNVIFYLPDKM